MDNIQVIMLLIGFLQMLMLGIGGWVLLQIVNHGNRLATLEAAGGENNRRFDELKMELDEIKKMLAEALLHRRKGD